MNKFLEDLPRHLTYHIDGNTIIIEHSDTITGKLRVGGDEINSAKTHISEELKKITDALQKELNQITDALPKGASFNAHVNICATIACEPVIDKARNNTVNS